MYFLADERLRGRRAPIDPKTNISSKKNAAAAAAVAVAAAAVAADVEFAALLSACLLLYV